MALRVKTRDGGTAVFMHVHKTGGSWVRQVLRETGVAGREIGGTHAQLCKVQIKEPDAQTFGFVRDPYDFLRSYFSHRHRQGWIDIDRELDRKCQASSFSRFLDLYLENIPGWVGAWYEAYVGEATFVGRKENLRADLCAALRKLNVEYDENYIMARGPINVTPNVVVKETDLGELESTYRLAVKEAEANAYEHWYPEEGANK